MNVVERHGFARAVEYRRLVHIVPESGDAVFYKLLIKTTPPLASLRAREIGKHGWTRPYNANEFSAIVRLHEVVAGMAGVVGRIALVGRVGDMQVRDGHEAKVLPAQIGNQPGKIGKCFRVHGE